MPGGRRNSHARDPGSDWNRHDPQRKQHEAGHTSEAEIGRSCCLAGGSQQRDVSKAEGTGAGDRAAEQRERADAGLAEPGQCWDCALQRGQCCCLWWVTRIWWKCLRHGIKNRESYFFICIQIGLDIQNLFIVLCIFLHVHFAFKNSMWKANLRGNINCGTCFSSAWKDWR